MSNVFLEDFNKLLENIPIGGLDPDKDEPLLPLENYTLADIEKAREQGWHEGHLQARQEAHFEWIKSRRNFYDETLKNFSTAIDSYKYNLNLEYQKKILIFTSALIKIFPFFVDKIGLDELKNHIDPFFRNEIFTSFVKLKGNSLTIKIIKILLKNCEVSKLEMVIDDSMMNGDFNFISDWGELSRNSKKTLYEFLITIKKIGKKN